MRQFYIQLRVLRAKDQHYWTLCLQVPAERLSTVETIVEGLEMGLRCAGAIQLTLEQIYFDYPVGPLSADYYKELGDPAVIEELKLFLGQKRDRRKKDQVEPAINSEDQP